GARPLPTSPRSRSRSRAMRPAARPRSLASTELLRHPDRGVCDEALPLVQPAGSLVRELGLEEDPLHAAGAAVRFETTEERGAHAAAFGACVDLVEDDVEPADLDRPAPRHDAVPVGGAVERREPDDAVVVIVEQRLEAGPHGRLVEGVP